MSNVSAIQPSQLDSDASAFLRPGAAPATMALDFLHEATHQWCFASPVGGVLAFLHARILTMSTWSHFGHEIPADEFYEDMLRLVTAREVLRPFAEGLAMFMELDANTEADTEFLSLPFDESFALFVDRTFLERGDLTDREKVTFALQAILRNARMSASGLSRRVGLLAEPLSFARGGYLPGYLAIKTLWLECARPSGKRAVLGMGDLFASYLRSYLYGDYSLVDVLLDPRTTGAESALAIIEHVKDRLHQFLRVVDMPQDLRTYERLARTDPNDVDMDDRADDPLLFLHVDDARYKRGAKVWRNIKEWTLTESLASHDEEVKRLAYTLQISRHFMHLAGLTGTVDANELGQARLTASDGRVLYQSRADWSYHGSGPGKLEVFFSTHVPDTRIVSLYNADGYLGLDLLGSTENSIYPLSEVLDEFHEVVGMREYLTEANPFIAEALRSHGMGDRVDRLLSALAARCTEIYWSLALAHLEWDVNAHGEELERDGLLLLPGLSRSNLEGAALLGLGAASRIPVDKLADQFQQRRLSLADTLRWLEALHEGTGFPAIVDAGGMRYTHF